ncbi:ArsR/SmtB family transcription factor [Rhizobium halophytocola]|nr:metalloregulator ArsR/SmtB family transcription factor [Rhizobium halophytocola]
MLKAAGEPTRIRLLVLLAASDLTVTDLTEILGQSQPRISRHLKLLAEAGLIDRYQEGAWAYFRLKQDGTAAGLAQSLFDLIDMKDPVLMRDGERLATVKKARAQKAQSYFSRHAGEWDALRKLHVADEAVEEALLTLIGKQSFEALLDLGTGTGRLLQLLEPRYDRAIGIDASRDMLAVARANLDRTAVVKASVRQGDILNLPLDDGAFDLVTIHQVLHFLDQPDLALAEAARMLTADGRLVVIDLAPHQLEYLREEHAHLRLGFSHAAMADWMERAGLEVDEVVDLRPDGGVGPGLTVTIWLAHRSVVSDAAVDAA